MKKLSDYLRGVISNEGVVVKPTGFLPQKPLAWKARGGCGCLECIFSVETGKTEIVAVTYFFVECFKRQIVQGISPEECAHCLDICMMFGGKEFPRGLEVNAIAAWVHDRRRTNEDAHFPCAMLAELLNERTHGIAPYHLIVHEYAIFSFDEL